MKYKQIPLKDLNQSLALAEYCFPTQPGTNRPNEMTGFIEKGAGLGGYVGNDLVSQLYAIPFEMNVFGVSIPMGGLATVSTYPEYRQGGHTKQLLLKSLEIMREKGQLLSVLAPFSESFYRYFGWELFFENTEYTIPIDQIERRQEEKGKVIRFSPDDTNWQEKVQAFHKQIVKTQNGLSYRAPYWWDRLHTRQSGSHYAACVNDDSEIQAYLRYRIDGREFQVLDLYAFDAKSERQLWGFISSHKSHIEKVTGEVPTKESFAFHFAQPDFEQKSFFDKMIRIVDVEKFLAVYPFKKLDKPLYVTIQDEHASWNDHTFKINADGKITKPKFVADEKVLQMEIGLFSAMMIGYQSPDWYRYEGYVTGTDQIIKAWTEAIPNGFPVFKDHF